MTKFYVELDGRQFIVTAGNALHAIAKYWLSDEPVIKLVYFVHRGVWADGAEIRSPAASMFLNWDQQERLLEHVDEQLSEADYRKFVMEATDDGTRQAD